LGKREGRRDITRGRIESKAIGEYGKKHRRPIRSYNTPESRKKFKANQVVDEGESKQGTRMHKILITSKKKRLEGAILCAIACIL